jgi:hypothetical protein
MDDSELAELQTALVNALHRASCPEEALSLLAEAPLSEASRRWLASSDPRSLETAIALVRRWSEFH